MTSPKPRLFRQIVAPLALAVLGCAGVVAGLILLLVQLHAPINPISGPDGPVSQVACGNSLSAPPLTGIFTDIDQTGGPGFFQQMADNACSHEKEPWRLGGWALVGVGILVLLGAGLTRAIQTDR